MDEYKCPKCGDDEVAATKKSLDCGNIRLLMIFCKKCGHFLGTVNDLADIKSRIDDAKCRC